MTSKAKTFGEFIRSKREQKGLSLRRFAELVGLSPTYVSQVETSAEPPPTADRARKMAKVLEEPEDVALPAAPTRIPGPPAVITKTMLKTWKEAMNEVMVKKNVVGDSRGSVICRNC